MAVFKKNVALNDGTKIWLRKDTGIVDSVKDWSETRIRSSGGGGYLQGGTGTVSAPIIIASNVHRQVFFLKCDDGTQKECSTTLVNVGVGHRVTEVGGAAEGKDSGHTLGFYNHTTDTYAFYTEKEYELGDFDKYRIGCMPLILWMLTIFVLFWVLAFMDTAANNYANDRIALVWLFLASIPACTIIYYRRRRHLPKFYQDLTSRALAFMREG